MSGPTGVEAEVCRDIAARQQAGIAKYGGELAESKDCMINHSYQEVLDTANYLKAEMMRHGEDDPVIVYAYEHALSLSRYLKAKMMKAAPAPAGPWGVMELQTFPRKRYIVWKDGSSGATAAPTWYGTEEEAQKEADRRNAPPPSPEPPDLRGTLLAALKTEWDHIGDTRNDDIRRTRIVNCVTHAIGQAYCYPFQGNWDVMEAEISARLMK